MKITVTAFSVFIMLGLFLGAASAKGGPFAYVTNSGSGTVSVLDTASGTLVAEIRTGFQPTGIAIAPDGKQGYVTSPHGIVVIDTVNNRAVQFVAADDPVAIAITPDGGDVYLTNGSGVAVLSTATNQITATVKMGLAKERDLLGIVISPDGKRAYVTSRSSVVVLDTATNTLVTVVPVVPPLGPRSRLVGIAVSSDGKHVYVPSGQAVAVLDAESNTVVATLPTGAATWMAIHPNGTHLYVLHDGVTLTMMDVTTKAQLATINIGGGSGAVAISADGKHAYVTRLAGTVLVLDTVTNRVEAEIQVGNIPTAIVVTRH